MCLKEVFYMDYKMDDSIGQNKCLGDKCPNHCCTEKFKGLSEVLSVSAKDSGMPLLNEEEVARIKNSGNLEYITYIEGKPYLKVYDNNRCAAFKDGKCLIYDVRPDVCKLYPFYFDQSCGFCKDKHCPGNFTLDDVTQEHYEILKKRINLYERKK